MRSQLRLVSILLPALVLLGSDSALARAKTSTPEDRAKAVRLARELETQPTSDDAPEKRRWLVKWWEKVPDITVTVCDLLGPYPKDDHPYFSQVVVQSIFSEGAFMIEHPDRANDKVAVKTAGVVGALKVYEAYVNAMPEGRLPFLDDLLKKSKDGTLDAHMREAVAKTCE